MKKNNKKTAKFQLHSLFFILTVAVSFLLRFWMLDAYPALNADEASNGYDAYSLIETGRDQHGNAWPVSFQSFNDFKPGLYVYLSIPFIWLMGLNEWSVRIPGAFIGVLSVVAVYFLVRELFSDKRLAITSALFLGISPWHIHFSRGGWEVNISTFFIILFLLFFFKSTSAVTSSKKISLILLSVINLAASLYAYHASRVLVPLLLAVLLVLYFKSIVGHFKVYLIGFIVFVLLITPLAIDFTNPQSLSRVAGVGLTADKGPIARINEQRGEHASIRDLLAKALHNKFVNYGLVFLGNWTLHFNGEFLFMSGDAIERNKVPETGQLYLYEILLVSIGLTLMVRSFGVGSKFVLAWLIFAPVASSLTFQSPNALRAQNMSVPLTIISAMGFVGLLDWLKTNKLKTGILLLAAIMIWNFTRYQVMYWGYMSKVYPFSSQYGLKELVTYLSNTEEYENIVVTTRYDQPYVLFLFYLKYPPAVFQSRHSLTSRDEYGFSTVPEFDKYKFEPVNFEDVRAAYPNSLIVGTSKEVPEAANIIKKINGTNGYTYFYLVSN